MDILRDMLDEFAQWWMESSNKRFAVGCGVVWLVILVVLGAVFAAGYYFGG